VTRLGAQSARSIEDRSMGRVLAEQFHQRADPRSLRTNRTQQIVTFPWYSTTHLDLQVQVEVYRFETDAQGNAQLSAKWTIRDGTGKNILYSAESI